MNHSLPTVHIVLLNYRGGEDTVACLESVLKLDYKNIKIIVCDNFSNDGSYEFIKDWFLNNYKSLYQDRFKKGDMNYDLNDVSYNEITRQDIGTKALHKKTVAPVTFIKSDKNLGYAGGNNFGMLYAKSDPHFEFIWILNNDTIVKKDSLGYALDNNSTFSNPHNLLTEGVISA